METPPVLRVVALAAIVASLGGVGAAHAEQPKRAAGHTPKTKVHSAPKASRAGALSGIRGPLPWCAEELETLPNALCYIDGRARADVLAQESDKSARRTLVIFLHGMIAKDVDWQWLQERALMRQAKQSKFEAVFARAPLGSGGYVWPGTLSAQETSEQDIIDGWS